jgi:hypothetical protein
MNHRFRKAALAALGFGLVAQSSLLAAAFDPAPRSEIAQASQLRARHKSGQTFLTWQEVNSPLRNEAV